MSDYKLERIVFRFILLIALLMFFQPLVRLHGPSGSQLSNAVNVQSKLSQFESNLRVMASVRIPADGEAMLVSASGAPAAVKSIPLPFSLRMASWVQWFVFAALGFCFLALMADLFFQKAVGVLSLLGGWASAVAVLQVLFMDTDLQAWTEVLKSAALINSARDPSGLIAMASSFVISPGFGLYVLTGCLFLVPVLSSTRAIPRVRSTMRHGRRVSLSQPVLVRPVNSRYPEENCTSLDVSEAGLLVATSLNHYYAGMEVYLSRNTGGSANEEAHGSVVRVEKIQNGKCHVGIRIIPEA